jgi:hypothetical protein
LRNPKEKEKKEKKRRNHGRRNFFLALHHWREREREKVSRASGTTNL